MNDYSKGFNDGLRRVRRTLDSHSTQEVRGVLDRMIDAESDAAPSLESALRPVVVPLPQGVEALRSMIPGPTGMAIDGQGRVLILRVNGNEYDTGVCALLERVKDLESELEQANIIVTKILIE